MTDLRAICNLSDEQFAARAKELRGGLLALANGREELSDGIALRFDSAPEIRTRLQEFVAFERGCCSSLGFDIREESGTLRLEILGIRSAVGEFAAIDGIAEEPKPERSKLPRLLRSAGLGTALSVSLCCLLPLGIATLAGASIAAPLVALDNPWIIAAGSLAFATLLWRRERKPAANKTSSSGVEGCGC
jgi:hypothetical protein